MFEVQFVAQGAQAGGRDLINGKQKDIALLLKRTGARKEPPISRRPADQGRAIDVNTNHQTVVLVMASPPLEEPEETMIIDVSADQPQYLIPASDK
jgi:hypothetical protein